MLDKETETLVKIILLMEPLSDEQKDRILTYLDMCQCPNIILSMTVIILNNINSETNAYSEINVYQLLAIARSRLPIIYDENKQIEVELIKDRGNFMFPKTFEGVWEFLYPYFSLWENIINLDKHKFVSLIFGNRYHNQGMCFMQTMHDREALYKKQDNTTK